LNADRPYPAPPADKRDAEAQVRYLSEMTNVIFKKPLSENAIRILRRFFASVGPENIEDLVGALMLELWESQAGAPEFLESDIIRAADRVRQRLIRASRRTALTDRTDETPSRELLPEEEIMLVLREFQTILQRSSPEEAIIFQRYYLDGQKDINALSRELHMSPATIYRRLGRIRKNFLSRRDATEPPSGLD
jgi:hypothetical protein